MINWSISNNKIYYNADVAYICFNKKKLTYITRIMFNEYSSGVNICMINFANEKRKNSYISTSVILTYINMQLLRW